MDLKSILVSLFLFSRSCSWSSFGVELISLSPWDDSGEPSLDIFWIFGPWVMNVFVRKKTSALVSFPLIRNLDFSIAARSHRWVCSMIAVVISWASFLALSTWWLCFCVRLSFFFPSPFLAFSTSFFVLAMNFRLSKNLWGNFPSWINFSSNSFMIVASEFFFK